MYVIEVRTEVHRYMAVRGGIQTQIRKIPKKLENIWVQGHMSVTPATQDSETERSRVQSQSRQFSEVLSQKQMLWS